MLTPLLRGFRVSPPAFYKAAWVYGELLIDDRFRAIRPPEGQPVIRLCARRLKLEGENGQQRRSELTHCATSDSDSDSPFNRKAYRKAAEQGLPGAKCNLGVMYQNGLGVEIDYQQAAAWYRSAADQGDVRGRFNLATLYMDGKGVPLDYVSADLWYTLAASAGAIPACFV
jgi:hypothetical protein